MEYPLTDSIGVQAMNKEKMPDGVGKFLSLLKKNKYVVIVLIVGVIILLIPTNSSDSGSDSQVDTDDTGTQSALDFSVEQQEDRLSVALSEIQGVGDVTVVLSLKTTMEQEVAVDEDSSGGQETVTVSTGSGTESPVTKKYIYPEYRGALIVAQGADNAEIRLEITQAVSALTGLGADKISVINKEN